MNREETKRAIEVMQAWLDGSDVERIGRNSFHRYQPNGDPKWNWECFTYRVKPKPREWLIEPKHGFVRSTDWPAQGYVRVREVLGDE